jgi:ABC-type branched-subunit amino acid transport system ATPase component/sugar phosphate permease
LSPERTPRPRFQLTRRLVGVSRWPLILLTIIYAIQVSDQYLLPSVFPYIKQEFGLSDTSLGVLSGSYFLVVVLGTVPFGILADRKRRTRIIAWGTTAWGACMIWTGLSSSYPSVLLARTSLGISDPCDNPTSQSLLGDYYPVNQRSKVFGVYQTGQLFGFILLPVGAGMAAAWGWRAAFFFFAVPGFIVSMLVWTLREPIRGTQDRKHQNIVGDATRPSIYDSMTTRQAYREILKVRTFHASLWSSTIASLFYGGIGTWTVTYLVRYQNLSVPQGASAVSLFALGGLVGALVAGYLADWLIFIGFPSARILMAGACRVGVFPLMYVAFTVHNTPVMLIMFTVGAVVLTASQPPLAAARLDVLHPSLRGRGTSLDALMQSLASAASPVVFGILSDHIGLRGAFLTLIPLSAVGGVVLLLFAVRSYSRDEQRVQTMVAAEAMGTSGSTITVNEPPPSAEKAAASAAATATTSPGATTTMNEGPLLTVDAIDVSYGMIQVLFGASMTVRRGGCHALVGRNGVGKSTLLRSIAGLVDPTAGRISFLGTDLTGVPPEQRVKLGLTLVVGGKSTFPSLSVRDNLWIGAFPFAGDHDLIAARTDAVLEIFPNLVPRLSQTGGTLSGGEQQMVALARALMAGPELLLVDELSLGLAPMVTEELLRAIARIVELGTTVLIVEQSLRVALRMAEEVFFMERGEVQSLGRADQLGSVDDLVRLMMGDAR